MKHLIVYSHPNPKSFNHAILETYTAALKHKGAEMRIRDLYTIGFSPALDVRDFDYYAQHKVPDEIQAEQDNIKWADFLTFIYPIWWTGLPAMVKGYIDRVFTNGFAFGVGADGVKGLLPGKKVFIFNTTGTPDPVYKDNGMLKSLSQTSDAGIFEFCGMEMAGHKYFAGVPYITDADRAAMLEEVKAIAENNSR
ncbi:MAG: NAD(P)H-dependent oxidoreductase [bacterium]